jgi:hypothetical protein
MSDKTWKKVERKIAELLGGVRVPVTGRGRGDMPDILHPDFSIEVKHREQFPDWLMDAMEQAVKSKRGAQIPLVVLHEKGQKFSQALCIIRLCDILETGGEDEST